MLLADARTPSGSFAHSLGLEAAVLSGTEVDGVADFILARLCTVGFVEACLAVAGRGAGSVRVLTELDEAFAARCAPAPLRVASGRLGRALLRTAGICWPTDELLAAYAAASSLTPRPVVLGVVARAGGVGASAVALLSLYDDAATVAAAAVKLLAVDAAEASGWVVGLAGEIERLAADAAGLGSAGSLPSTSTPLLDRRASAFSMTDRRLFAS
jgi:urease accessory protein